MISTMSKQQMLEKIKRFIVEEGECWIWSGRISPRGYPLMYVDGVRPAQSVRRVSLIASGVNVGKGAPVKTKCGNRLCVNPDCCVKTTWTGVRKDYYQSGAYDSAAKLVRAENARQQNHLARGTVTMENAIVIRQSGLSAEEEAKKHGTSVDMILKVRTGRACKDRSASVFNPFSVLGM